MGQKELEQLLLASMNMEEDDDEYEDDSPTRKRVTPHRYWLLFLKCDPKNPTKRPFVVDWVFALFVATSQASPIATR